MLVFSIYYRPPTDRAVSLMNMYMYQYLSCIVQYIYTHMYVECSCACRVFLCRIFSPKSGERKSKILTHQNEKGKCLAEDGFDPSTSGLWAQHASTAPLCFLRTPHSYLSLTLILLSCATVPGINTFPFKFRFSYLNTFEVLVALDTSLCLYTCINYTAASSPWKG